MAAKKSEEFDEEDIKLAEFAKALAHPARIAIMKKLAEQNVCICGEIVDVIPLAQATVSQHLKELKKAGLIDGSVDGVKSCYCINPKALEGFDKLLSKLFKKLDKCC
jgi:DNA-binding transcriptional ArsR family regulator